VCQEHYIVFNQMRKRWRGPPWIRYKSCSISMKKNHFVRSCSVPVLFVAAGFDFSLLRSGLYFCSVFIWGRFTNRIFPLACESWQGSLYASRFLFLDSFSFCCSSIFILVGCFLGGSLWEDLIFTFVPLFRFLFGSCA
jgi:hypothetical protein